MRATEQKKPKNGVFLKVMAIAVAVYILYFMISNQAKISDKNAELNTKKQEYTESLIRNEELQKTLDSYGTDEFIEEQAREKLGYAHPEEHFYVDVSGTD